MKSSLQLVFNIHCLYNYIDSDDTFYAPTGCFYPQTFSLGKFLEKLWNLIHIWGKNPQVKCLY